MIKDFRRYWIIKLLLYPLAFLYGLITHLRNLFYDHRLFTSNQYDIPIISIGNIIAGGTGKTPFTMLCIDLLRSYYRNIVIVSRGYGRESKGLLVVSDGQGNIQPAKLGGDEPSMIARKYPQVPVIVSEVRKVGIEKAIQIFDANLILLDDAFQHRSVARDCDIVLINGMRSLSGERLLPAGDLREKITNLKRADIVVLNESHKKLDQQDILYLNHIYEGPVFSCHFLPKVLVDSRLQKISDITVLKGKEVYLFSAIASPEQFKTMIADIGATIKKVRIYPDHYFYRPSDFEQIKKEYQELNCDYLITTEKDLVKIESSVFDDINFMGLGLEGNIITSKSFVDKLNQYIDIKI